MVITDREVFRQVFGPLDPMLITRGVVSRVLSEVIQGRPTRGLLLVMMESKGAMGGQNLPLRPLYPPSGPQFHPTSHEHSHR